MSEKIYMNYIHPSSLLRQLSDLWKTEELCDAVITVDKVIVAKAHKLVLFAISSKLKADSKSSSQSAFLEVNLPTGLLHKSVHSFLKYIYEGFLLLSKDLVNDVIKIGEFLNIPCLLNCCDDYVKNVLNSADSASPSEVETKPKDFNHVRCEVTKEAPPVIEKRARSVSVDDEVDAKKQKSDSGASDRKHSVSSKPESDTGQISDEASQDSVYPNNDNSEMDNEQQTPETAQSSHSQPQSSHKNYDSYDDDDVIEIKEEPDDDVKQEITYICDSEFPDESSEGYSSQRQRFSNTFQGQSSSASRNRIGSMPQQSISNSSYLNQGMQNTSGQFAQSDSMLDTSQGQFSQSESMLDTSQDQSYAAYSDQPGPSQEVGPIKCACSMIFDDLKDFHSHDSSCPCRQYQCHLCPKRCTNNGHLRSHLFKHSDSPMFNCDHCGKKYRQQQSLRRHVRTVHMDYTNSQKSPGTHTDNIVM